MKILITGGNGLIGYEFVKQLHKLHDIYVIDINEPEIVYDNVHYLIQDLRDGIDINDLDMIIHLAAIVGVNNVIDDPFNVYKNNTECTDTVLDYLKINENCSLVFSSSSEVYCGSDKCEENTLINILNSNRWLYAKEKYESEQKFKKINNNWLITRLFNVVGPYQKKNQQMVYPTFVRNFKQHDDIIIFGDGSQTRSFTDVKDTVFSIISLINNQCWNNIVNISSPYYIDILTMADYLKKTLNSNSHIIFDNTTRKNEIKHRHSNIKLLQKLTNYNFENNIFDIFNKYLYAY